MKAKIAGLCVTLLATVSVQKSASAQDNLSCAEAGTSACLTRTNNSTGGALKGITTNTGVGVWGQSTNSTNMGYGVYGTAVNAGSGVVGVTASGYGVRGLASSSGGVGGYFSAPVGGTAIVASTPGGTVAWLDGNVYAGSYGSTSDARLKKEVRDLSYGLEAVLELRPVSFKWKRDHDGKNHLGLIAQEVEKILPEVVSHSNEPSGTEVMTVAYSEILPLLINAVQQQNRLIVQQEARIVALERGRSSMKLSSMLGGGALLGLVPVGLVVASRRRKGQMRSRGTE